MVDFDVYSEDPEDHKLIARYWAMDTAGNFVETVNHILPYREILKTHQLVKYINEISTASDLNKICERCENNFEVRSRSDVKTKLTVLQGVCATCQSIEEYERIKTADSERAELQERLAQTE